MDYVNPRQRILLSADYLFDLKGFSELELLFRHLPSALEETQRTGRPRVSYLSLLKCFIYRSISTVKNLSELRRSLVNNPSLSLTLGFDPLHVPSLERFSSFLNSTSPRLFKGIQVHLVKKLMDYRAVSGKYLTLDACSVPLQVRENNLKTSAKERFNKMHPPQGDPEAGLGIMLNYPRPFRSKATYFWGYKNHILSDALSELPLLELTKPAHVSEGNLLIPLIQELKEQVELHPHAVIADAAYDWESNLKFIMYQLKAKPIIARNLRWEKHRDHTLSRKGTPICIAGLEMTYWGRFPDRGKVRLKYVCPITHLRSYREKYRFCPWNHPKFTKGKGCYVYLRADDTVRGSIGYGSAEFRRVYNLRTASERIISRLASLGMQSPSVRGLTAVSNWCSITHISLLLIALAAHQTNNKERMRFVKNFLPNL